MTKVLKATRLTALLLTLWACSSTPIPDCTGSLCVEPPVAERLESPLLEEAVFLSVSDPDSNYVRLLEVGSDALLTRIHLIRSARRSIELQTMIWANDETGRLIMYELIQAARRGVQVRLLIDHLASEQHIDVASFLGFVHPNLQIRLYNPITGLFGQLKAEPSFFDKLNALVFKFDRLNRRMHNKTFIVDDLVGITGGRNYQNAYYDQAIRMNYKDRDVLVIGPAAGQMKRSFESYWNFKRSEPLTELVDVKDSRRNGIRRHWHSRASFGLNGLFDALDHDASDPKLIERLLVEPLLVVADAQFIADDPGDVTWSAIRDNGRSRVTEELAALVGEARESVTVQTPYLILTDQAMALFKKLRKRSPGIDVRISTNSLAATDSWHVYAISYKQKKIYLDDLKFRIYEFKPIPGDLYTYMPGYAALHERAEQAHYAEQERWAELHPEPDVAGPPAPPAVLRPPYFCLHSKSLVIDHEVAFVGSYNLDPRSENINTECGLVVRDLAFARLLGRYIRIDMQPQNAWVIAQKDRPDTLNDANEVMLEISHLVPLVDLWPFRYAASFELKGGKEAVDIHHPDFYRNYRDVGSFPQVGSEEMGKELGVHGTRMFFGFVKPLL